MITLSACGAPPSTLRSEEREKKLHKLHLTATTVSDLVFQTPRWQYKADENVVGRVTALNTSGEPMVVVARDGFTQYFTRLLKDGRPLPYTAPVKEHLASASESVRSKASGVRLPPNEETLLGLVILNTGTGSSNQEPTNSRCATASTAKAGR